MLKYLMVKDILQIGHPILTQKTRTVTDFEDSVVRETIVNLLDTCIANKSISAGLAAPQIGSDLSICVVRRTDLEDSRSKKIADDQLWKVLINPTISGQSDSFSEIWEACLSIGTGRDRLYGPVSRPAEVEISFADEQGIKQTIAGEGFFSHLLQHEIDHLNGKLFISYISNPSNLWRSADLDNYLAENDQYPIIK